MSTFIDREIIDVLCPLAPTTKTVGFALLDNTSQEGGSEKEGKTNETKKGQKERPREELSRVCRMHGNNSFIVEVLVYYTNIFPHTPLLAYPVS